MKWRKKRIQGFQDSRVKNKRQGFLPCLFIEVTGKNNLKLILRELILQAGKGNLKNRLPSSSVSQTSIPGHGDQARMSVLLL